MSAGYLLRGTCYKTPADVAAAISAQYPQQQGADVFYLKNAPAYSGGAFSYTVWSGTTQTTDSVSITPPSCDTNNVPSDPLFSVVMFAACAVMFGLGFIGTR
jgi:hypothetical protein